MSIPFIKKLLPSFPFFIIMKLGVAFTFVKMMFVAAYTPSNVFVQYALFLSLGYFLGYVLSLGVVEGSVKAFPKLMAEKKITLVYSIAAKVIRRLIINFLFLFFFLVITSKIFQIEILQAFILASLALIGSLTSLIASVHRAIDQPTKMAVGSFSRAFIAFVFVSVVIIYSGVASSILLAEVVGGVVGILISAVLAGMRLISFWPKKVVLDSKNEDSSDLGSLKKGGRLVALGYLFNSVPFYLDKWAANITLPESQSAIYIYVATLLTVAVVMMNTISQLIGARLIKFIQIESLLSANKHVLSWIAAAVVAWAVLVVSYFLMSEWELLPDALSKYELSFEILFLLFLLGTLYTSQLYEFVVIGLDMEVHFVQASIAHLIILSILLIWVRFSGGGITEFMFALAASRGFYLSLLLILIHSKRDYNAPSA